MPKTSLYSHFALSLLGALSLHAFAQNVPAVAGAASTASAAVVKPAGAASSASAATPAQASAETKKPEASKPEAKALVGTLSSARTIRELLEIDDRMALAKERKILADELKKTEKEPVANAAVNVVSVASARAEAESKAQALKQAKALASTIKIDAIMGVQGERVIQANIAGKQSWIRESNPTAIAGWLMVAVKGSCATFERRDAPAQKAKNLKVATGGSSKRSQGVQTTEQTVCFKLPEAYVPPPAVGSGGAGAMPLPIPLPFPAPFNSPQRIAPVAPIANL